MSSICAIEIEAILFLFMMNYYKSSFQECITIIVLIIGREEPVAILFISATRKDCIPPPPVGLSWDSPHPPPESVRTDGRMDGRMLTSEPKFFDQWVTKFAYPWCSASSAMNQMHSPNSIVLVASLTFRLLCSK